MDEKPKRKRAPGGGRKSAYAEATIRTSIVLTPSHLELLKRYGSGNVSKGIRLVLELNWKRLVDSQPQEVRTNKDVPAPSYRRRAEHKQPSDKFTPVRYRIIVGEKGNEQGHVVDTPLATMVGAKRAQAKELAKYGRDGWSRIEEAVETAEGIQWVAI